MKRRSKHPPKPLQWRLECLGHSLVEVAAGRLPGSWVFRLGEVLGELMWWFMPARRRAVLRNLRIAFAGERDLEALRHMARQSFRRSGANLISAARTARLDPRRLPKVIEIENLDLLEQEIAAKRGVVLLLSHMGNWEILSRIVHLFPPGSKTGAFYRPLNNPLLDDRILRRRQADGTRMFSKRDNPHHVAAFLREGGIVGILADQRVGLSGEPVAFFGRRTRASPLPSLLARRTKSGVLAFSVHTVAPGKWRAVFHPVEKPHTTANCMRSLEEAMRSSPVDVFWLQERWKIYVRSSRTIGEWLGDEECGGKPHRVLLWRLDSIPDDWKHPDVLFEAALREGDPVPNLPGGVPIHRIPETKDIAAMRSIIGRIDDTAPLPLDLILARDPEPSLAKACKRESIPLCFLR